LSIAAECMLVLRWPLSSAPAWTAIGGVGAATVLSYAILAEYFPTEAIGPANGALNTFHFGFAFLVQLASGLVIQQWGGYHGHYPAIAYQVALALTLLLQLAAVLWFVAPAFQRALSDWRDSREMAIHVSRKVTDLLVILRGYSTGRCGALHRHSP